MSAVFFKVLALCFVCSACAQISDRPPAPPPLNFHELECKLHALAYEFGLSKVSFAAAALHDALNLGNCSTLTSTADNHLDKLFNIDVARDQQKGNDLRIKEQENALERAFIAAQSTFYISVKSGSDDNDGSKGHPFKSLARAKQASSVAVKPVLVLLSAGKYFLNRTLQLDESDSYVTWAANPAGAKVVISGGKDLSDLTWQPSKTNPNILVADVSDISDLQSSEEQSFWSSSSSSNQIQETGISIEDFGIFNSSDLPPATAGWQLFPGHCMGDYPCSKVHCSCASKHQLAEKKVPNPSNLSHSYDIAFKDCKATTNCRSFAIMIENYELFSVGNNSAVPNTDWQSYAIRETPAPPPAPPPAHQWGAPPALWNTLHIDGQRQIRARFPNGNPQDNSGLCFSKVNHPTEGCPGYLSAHGNPYKEPNDQHLPSSKIVAEVSNSLDRSRAPASPVAGGQGAPYGSFHYNIFDPPNGHPVYNKPMPDWSWTNKSLFSFWQDPMSRPSGLVYGDDIDKVYANPGAGVVHIFHTAGWGGWQYQVSSQHQASQSLLFSHGGYQEARGAHINSQHYFVENIFEELDVPGEWYHDPKTSTLFFYPNSTTTLTDEVPFNEVVAPLLSASIRVEGASNVTFLGITLTETRATYLDQYEVSSGGDWAVHRGGALEIVDSKFITVSGCVFTQVGGNGILLSRNATDVTIFGNEFMYIGDSAIVSIGVTEGILGDAATYPDRNVISNNHIHEIGVYGKQTSCYFQSLSGHTVLKDNICYNGPRAGINWNDGFTGGNIVSGNLVFNMVRETGDHGPYNSWDRQPYLTLSGIDDGYNASLKPSGHENASILKKPDLISRNFFINGYNGVWTIDHDDGSQYFNDTANLMLFGGCKNYLGNHKSCDGNVIVHPGIDLRSAGGRRCQTDDNTVFANQYHGDNHCITQDGVAYSMTVQKCTSSSIDPHVYQTFNNTFYSPQATFSNGPCKNFASWQAAGQDHGSRVLPMLQDENIVKLGRSVLQMA